MRRAAIFAGVLLCAASVRAGAYASKPSVACNIKLLTDLVPDMSSVEEIIKNHTRPGMTAQEKCLAVWDVYWRHRFPNAGSYAVEHGHPVYDPVLLLNSYGRTICQQDAALTCALWAALGYDVRFWQIVGHTVSEVSYGGRWHQIDGAGGLYFYLEDNRTIAGVEDLEKWMNYDERCSSWGKFGTTRVPNEPGHLCLRHCPVCTDMGRLKQHGHKLYGDKDLGGSKHNNDVQKFDEYEAGHRMNITVRRGEVFTRYWHPLGETEDYWRPASNKKKPIDRWGFGQRWTLQKGGGLTTWKKHRLPFDIRKDAAYANGELITELDLKTGDLSLIERKQGIAYKRNSSPRLTPRTTGAVAEFIVRVETSYVVTGAWVEGSFVRKKDGDVIEIELAPAWGQGWKKVWTAEKKGTFQESIRLYPHVAAGFGFLVKLRMRASSSRSCGLDAFRIRTIMEVNPFSLPALHLGRNEVRFETGKQLATLRVWPDLSRSDYKEPAASARGTSNTRSRWHKGLDAGGGAELVYRVAPPGEIRSFDWGGRFRRDARAEMSYSADGRSWTRQPWTYRYTRKNDEAWSRNPYMAIHERTERLPRGLKQAFFKYAFRGSGYALTSLLINVDYVPPGAGTKAAPVEVGYCWEEHPGGEKVFRQVLRSPAKFMLNVGGSQQPTMKWVSLRVAGR